MAYSNPHATKTAACTGTGPFTNLSSGALGWTPTLGQLLVCNVGCTKGSSPAITLPTDNATGGGAWNAFSAQLHAGTSTTYMRSFYKVLTSGDVNTLTSVQANFTTATSGGVQVAEIEGFISTPTIDQPAQTGVSDSTTEGLVNPGAPNTSGDLALGFLGLSGAPAPLGASGYAPLFSGTPDFTYATNVFQLGPSPSVARIVWGWVQLPTTTDQGSVFNWTASLSMATAGVLFRDPGMSMPVLQSGLPSRIAVKRSANW